MYFFFFRFLCTRELTHHLESFFLSLIKVFQHTMSRASKAVFSPHVSIDLDYHVVLFHLARTQFHLVGSLTDLHKILFLSFYPELDVEITFEHFRSRWKNIYIGYIWNISWTKYPGRPRRPEGASALSSTTSCPPKTYLTLFDRSYIPDSNKLSLLR